MNKSVRDVNRISVLNGSENDSAISRWTDGGMDVA